MRSHVKGVDSLSLTGDFVEVTYARVNGRRVTTASYYGGEMLFLSRSVRLRPGEKFDASDGKKFAVFRLMDKLRFYFSREERKAIFAAFYPDGLPLKRKVFTGVVGGHMATVDGRIGLSLELGDFVLQPGDRITIERLK